MEAGTTITEWKTLLQSPDVILIINAEYTDDRKKIGHIY